MRFLASFSFLACVTQLPSVFAASIHARTIVPRTVNFEVNLTWEDAYEVGRPKKTILVNGISPGPRLEMTVGDSVEFVVNNNMPFNTTIHFHGITQLGTPWSDGVPGVAQSPIQPGQKFIYRWTANEHGQYFYHAHSRGQLADGCFGPIVIQPSANQSKPFSMISNSSADVQLMEIAEANPTTISVTDWFQEPFQDFYDQELASGVDDFCPDAVLINGKGSVRCPGIEYINSLVNPAIAEVLDGVNYTAKGCLPVTPVTMAGLGPKNISALPTVAFNVCTPTTGTMEVIEVDPVQRWVSLNFYSPAAISAYAISIDEHQMWVYAVDGRYVQPQLVDQVYLANGYRYSVLVNLKKPVGDYLIRASNGNSAGVNQIITAYATLSYLGSTHQNNSTSKFDYAGANITADYVLLEDFMTNPLDAVTPPDADVTYFYNINHFFDTPAEWTLSGNASYDIEVMEDQYPLLFAPNSSAGLNQSITLRTKNNQWVDIVFQNHGPFEPPHPIHKHSNKFYVLGSGTGTFNWTSVAEAQKEIPESFNLVNPVPRDTYNVPGALSGVSWLAIRYHSMNPGAFFMHCHIQSHLSGGMAVQILDGIDAWPSVPPEYQNNRSGY